MRKSTKKALLLAIGAIVAVTLFAGCQEEKQSDAESSITRSKLIAAENRQLRKDITKLKELHKKEIKRQEKLLDKCLQEKKALGTQASKALLEEMMSHVLTGVTEENAELREENESLKSQIKMLQAQIAQLKKQLKELRKRPTIRPQPL